MSGDNYYSEAELEAIEAERILNSRVFNKIFDSLKQEYIDAIEVMDSTDKELLTEIALGIKNLSSIKYKLQSYIDTIKLKQEYNNNEQSE